MTLLGFGAGAVGGSLPACLALISVLQRVLVAVLELLRVELPFFCSRMCSASSSMSFGTLTSGISSK